MKEAKFTKGPWIVNSNGSYFNIGPKNDCSTIPVYPDVCIGAMHYDEANANLIAVSPEMYEFIETHMGGHPEAEALLAKARGEQ